MRRLVLATMVACIASLATGCIISSDDDDTPPDDVGSIRADWTFHTAAGGALGCPAGFATTRVTAKTVDGGDCDPLIAGSNTCVDLYDCVDGTGTGDLLATDYDVTIEITDGGNGVYGSSLTLPVDITVNDGAVDEDFIDDGGRLTAAWALVDATTNAALTCATAGNPDAISFDVTLTGPNTLTTDLFECADESGISDPLIAGSYVVSVSAVNTQGQALGAPQNKNVTLGDQNDYQDLGTITLPID